MSEDSKQKTITDRSTSYRPSRFGAVWRVGAVTAVGLVIGAGYFGVKFTPSDATAKDGVVIPAPDDANNAPAAKPSLFQSAYPKLDQPELEGPSEIEIKLSRVEDSLTALDERLAALAAMPPADPSAAFEAKVAALEASGKAIRDTLEKTRKENEEERAAEKRRRDALQMELTELRTRMLTQPAPFGGSSDAEEIAQAEAEHRREMARLRLEAELAAVERVEMRKLEEDLAAREHTRRIELASIEKQHAERTEQAKFERDRQLLELEARLRANEISVERAAAERKRIAAEHKAEAERMRAKAEADRAEAKAEATEREEAERVRRESGGIVIDDTGAVSGNGTQVAGLGTPASAAAISDDASRLLLEGTLIAGVLETAIQSDMPGSIRAVVSEDVWSADASQIILPKGSRLIGRYESGVSQGQSRVLIAWSRAVTPDHRSITLNSSGVDGLGRAGLSGDVDQHFGTKFEAAFLISVVSAIGQFGANAALPRAEVREALNTGSETVTETASDALGEYLSIPPTIHVDQGTPINVFVQQDFLL